MVKWLQGDFRLISCNSRHYMTNCGLSYFQKDIALEEGTIITLYSLWIAQTLWRATGWGEGGFCCVFVFSKVICLQVT